MLSDFRRAKGEHDPVFGNAGVFQFPSNTIFCPIPLNPKLTVNQVYMDDAAMYSPIIPADNNLQIVIARSVKNCLTFDITVGIGNTSMFEQYALDDLAVGI